MKICCIFHYSIQSNRHMISSFLILTSSTIDHHLWFHAFKIDARNDHYRKQNQQFSSCHDKITTIYGNNSKINIEKIIMIIMTIIHSMRPSLAQGGSKSLFCSTGLQCRGGIHQRRECPITRWCRKQLFGFANEVSTMEGCHSQCLRR